MSYLDYDEVAPGLYIGAFPKPEDVPKYVDAVVFCARELQPSSATARREYGPRLDLIKVPLDDAPLTSEQKSAAWTAARAVARRLVEGKKVLVTCAKGVNRSALVAALALMLVTHRPGWYAANVVRERRKPRTMDRALMNSSFFEYLKSLGPAQ